MSVLDVSTRLEGFLELLQDPFQNRDASNDLLAISLDWEGDGYLEDRLGGV